VVIFAMMGVYLHKGEPKKQQLGDDDMLNMSEFNQLWIAIHANTHHSFDCTTQNGLEYIGTISH
jgi:hypothetical protein